uniref:cyclin-dependent kinase G-2-like n=1 Tax=Erigeron canadensis TaxID=72917 RepID=UPI001CB8F4CC|nr:cyclin-dependent kinase G-2-like [Erigeron canadensis]
MAAGRQNVSRKRYSNRFEEETYSYKKRYDQRVSSTVFAQSSGGRSSDRGRSVHRLDHGLQYRNREGNDCLNSGITKKRKFSPIVWEERVEKKVVVSSTNSIFSGLSPPNSRDASIERCSVDSLVSNVSDGVEVPNSFASTTPDQQVEIEDGEYVDEPKLSKSKWALEDLATDVNCSSPESGEFKREGSEGNGVMSSLSSEHGQPEYVGDKVSSDDMDYYSSESEDELEISLRKGLGMPGACRNVFEYERLGKISEGTYGVVYKARDKKTGEIVALKKVKSGKESEGFPITALREISVLSLLQHPSVVDVKEVVMDDFNGVYMVMEYVDNELKGYMERMKHPFSQSEVKSLMLQLLEGLSYLHDNYVMHRDLKTSNLLLNNKGEMKICDFGMARRYSGVEKPYTSLVVTLWYRAPEVLLGMKQYTTAIDMWSVGCIMAELLTKKPLFDGKQELEQVSKIFSTLGTPNDSIWPGYSKLPGVKANFVKQPYSTLKKKFPVASFTGAPTLTELGFDLLSRLLTYDPKKRITAEDALNHGWFREAPLPAEHVRICR